MADWDSRYCMTIPRIKSTPVSPHGVPRCVNIVWPCTDDLEEIETRQLHVCGAHAREGLADEGITGLLVALLGLLVTLRFKKERLVLQVTRQEEKTKTKKRCALFLGLPRCHRHQRWPWEKVAWENSKYKRNMEGWWLPFGPQLRSCPYEPS